MKHFLSSLILCAAVPGASAQNLAASYTCTSTSLKDGETKIESPYVLVADGSASMFYNPEKWAYDSLKSTPEGEAALRQQALALITSGKPLTASHKGYYVIKRTDGSIRTYDDDMYKQQFLIDEPFETIGWQLGDSAKTVLGYKCQNASALFHGRKWTVWFTPDIPLQEGPWKLRGLPGLILEAEADGGVYGFKATAIGLTNEAIPPVYGIGDYHATDRMSYLREKRSFTDNAMQRLSAAHGPTFKVYNADGTPVTTLYAPRNVIDFIETDY